MQPELILVRKPTGFVFPHSEPQRTSGVLAVLQRTCMLWLIGYNSAVLRVSQWNQLGFTGLLYFRFLKLVALPSKRVNAHHVKTLPGRKSDVLDCQWIQQLHSYGLLSASFRPDDQVCVLRSYIRQRDNLVRSACVHVQRMQKALTEMNVQLHQVVSDITGTTGMAIIRAIVAAEHDPKTLAALRHPRTRRSATEIAQALQGDYRPEHLFILQQELTLYEAYQVQLSACDAQIEQCLSNFDVTSEIALPVAGSPRRRPQDNQPAFDLQTHLQRISGVDFTQIDGIGA